MELKIVQKIFRNLWNIQKVDFPSTVGELYSTHFQRLGHFGEHQIPSKIKKLYENNSAATIRYGQRQ